MNDLLSIVLSGATFFGVLLVLVVTHELGHFLTAKLAGVAVQEFGIGYPPRLFALHYRGTDYSVNLFPLGGFVKLLGEEDPLEEQPQKLQSARVLVLDRGAQGSPEAPKPSAGVPMASKSPWTRLLILAAGPGMNALLSILLLSIAFSIPHNVLSGPVHIETVAKESPAERAGLQSGDIVRKIDDREIRNMQDVSSAIQLNLGTETVVTFQRGSEARKAHLVPRWDPPPQQGAIGVVLSMPVTVVTVKSGTPAAVAGLQTGDRIQTIDGRTVRLIDEIQLEPQDELVVVRGVKEQRLEWNGPNDPTSAGLVLSGPSVLTVSPQLHEALLSGARTTFDFLTLLTNGVRSVITSDGAVALTGPVGIAQTTAEAANGGLPPLLHWMAFLSLNLAVMNILPLPMLDGGRVAFVLLEWVRHGRRLAPKIENFVHLGGFAMLLGVILVITYQDIMRLLGTQ